ncbi:MAG: phosphopentomutase [Eubacteriales bacterium]|nr:phosphopentomutase [Eubacteriales bacterium]MCI7570338.1 phosphopentomutase [Clostridiales bacterium]
MKKRAILIILDSVGIGALPDAAEFGDKGANTLGNIYRARGGINLPNLYALGLANIDGALMGKGVAAPAGAFGKAAEITKAKDTTCGHWEISGLLMDKPFQVFPNGFPEKLMHEFEEKIGRKTLCNFPASGTAIINEYGDEHMRTGYPIVYTSADSVFQVAAHEDVIPLEELYKICETARELLYGDYFVGRVIARPFIGSNGKYTRTENRRDYAVEPTGDTILDALTREGKKTIAIGKIEDIFAHRGITVADHTKNNHDGIEATIKYISEGEGDFIFTNLVDFDMLYGHRNDVEGYAKALEYFDEQLTRIIEEMKDGDILIISADHGCDPTYPGTDHTREYIPVLACGDSIEPGTNLGVLDSFADIGASIYEYLTDKKWAVGDSFLS